MEHLEVAFNYGGGVEYASQNSSKTDLIYIEKSKSEDDNGIIVLGLDEAEYIAQQILDLVATVRSL